MHPQPQAAMIVAFRVVKLDSYSSHISVAEPSCRIILEKRVSGTVSKLANEENTA